jgi:drug/metabolite transporter (DMT)-like permease
MTQQKTMTTRAWIELLTLSLIWGGSFLSVEFTLRELSVLWSVAHRVIWAALALWIYVLIRGLTIPRSLKTWAAFLGMGVLNNVLPFSLITYGQVFIESGLASILNGATALFGVVLAAIVFRDERLTANKIAGVLLGFAGVSLAVGPSALAGFGFHAIGQIAVLGGALSYALAGVFARKALSGMSGPMAAAGMLTASSLIILPLAYFIDGPPKTDLAPATLIALVYYALFATAFAYVLYYRVLSMAGSANLLLVTLFLPFVAIFLGALVLQERLASSVFAGFGLITLGMIVLDGRLIARLRARLSD